MMLKRLFISCVLAAAFLVPTSDASAWYRYRMGPVGGYYGRPYGYGGYYGPRYYGRPYVRPYYGGYYGSGYYGGAYVAPYTPYGGYYGGVYTYPTPYYGTYGTTFYY